MGAIRLDDEVDRQTVDRPGLERAGKLDLDDQVQIFPATGILGAATRDAISAATAWLREQGVDIPQAGDEGPRWVD